MSSLDKKTNSVSVVLCTYNGAKFIEEQLMSIINQSYRNITEIICVDDCSTDQTVQIIERLQSQFPQIRLEKNEVNLGYIRNFEKAMSMATSEFIAISDQDDVWYQHKVQRLMDAIGDNLMVYSDTEYIDEYGAKTGKKLSDYRVLGKSNDCLNFVLFNGVSGHTMIVRKRLYEMALPFNQIVPYDYW